MVKKYATYLFLLIFISTVYYITSSHNKMPIEDGILTKAPSTDAAELMKYIFINENLSDLRWEIFGTPEWSNNLPSPTDFATLIVTGKTQGVDSISYNTSNSIDYFLPNNSNRSWLTEQQSLIIESITKEKKISLSARCATKMYKAPSTVNEIEGIECRYDHDLLIIIVLKQPS